MRHLACLALLCLTACATTGSYPPAADLTAVIEPKPRPTVDILTDPVASDLYNSSVEAAFDRVHSAGVRLCRYFARTGMDVACD